jgi:hypothetical protein
MGILLTSWYKIFYWMTVADGIKSFFDHASNIFTTFTIISLILLVIASIGKASNISQNNLSSDEEDKTDADVRSWEKFRLYTSKFFYTCLTLALLTWMGYAFTPTKKDALFIVAGGAAATFVTTDSSAKHLPSDLTNYLHVAIQEQTKNLTDDTKKALGIKIQDTVVTPVTKQTLLNKVEALSKEQLVEYLKDSSIKLSQ